MNSIRLARDYLKRAQDRLAAIELLFQRGAFADVVREAQEVFELCLKGSLRYLSIEPPKRHNVADVLQKHIDLLPEKWKVQLGWIEKTSRRLFEERSHAFYGDEVDLVPASEIFQSADAERALNDAKAIIQLFAELMNS